MVIRVSMHGLRLMGYPPTDVEYDMPALAGLFDKNMLNIALDRVSGRFQGPKGYPYFQMWMNLVRLTDLSITSYEQARASLNAYRDRGHEMLLSPYYDAVNQLEEAVVATHRASLNSAAIQPGVRRKLKAPSANQASDLRQIRNHIQHMDDRLARGQVKKGDLHVLGPIEKGVVIGKIGIHYVQLPNVIKKMHRNIEIVRGVPNA